MNFFTKTRFLLAVIIILSAIILAMIGTMGYKKYRFNNEYRERVENRKERQLGKEKERTENKERTERGKFMAKQLQLTPEQIKEFDDIRDKFHNQLEDLTVNSRQLSRDIMEEISSENPDTNKLNALSEKFGETQKAQKEMMIKHLLEIRSKCSPSQQANFKKVLRRIENHDRMYRERRQNTEKRDKVEETK